MANRLKKQDGDYWLSYQIGKDEYGPWHRIYWRDAQRVIKEGEYEWQSA